MGDTLSVLVKLNIEPGIALNLASNQVRTYSVHIWNMITKIR